VQGLGLHVGVLIQIPATHEASLDLAYPAAHVKAHTPPLNVGLHAAKVPCAGVGLGWVLHGRPMQVSTVHIPKLQTASLDLVYPVAQVSAQVPALATLQVAYVPCEGFVGELAQPLAPQVPTIVHAPRLHVASPDLVYPVVHVRPHIPPDATLVHVANVPKLGGDGAEAHGLAPQVAACQLPRRQVASALLLYPIAHVNAQVAPLTVGAQTANVPCAVAVGELVQGLGVHEGVADHAPRLQVTSPDLVYPIAQVKMHVPPFTVGEHAANVP